MDKQPSQDKTLEELEKLYNDEEFCRFSGSHHQSPRK
jgi:hypothetical protein